MSSYPQHEFSKYIDGNMSFDNKVYPTAPASRKSNMVYQLKNIRCDGGLSLEPRLQEYIKKKKRYKDDNIKPCISLEREFMITKDDLSKIKAFMKGNRNIYGMTDWPMRDICHKKPIFPSKGLRDDPRVPKPVKPEIHTPVKNRGMFYPETGSSYYDDPFKTLDKPIDLRDVQGFDLDDTRFDPRSDPKMFAGREENSRDASHYQVRRKQVSNKHKKKVASRRKKSMKDIIGYTNDVNNNMDVTIFPNSRLDTLMNMSDRYKKLDEPVYQDVPNMKYEKDYVVPNITYRSNQNLTSDYLGDNEYGDVNLETCMTHGMPTHTTKSYGYRNPSEHYYQYIDDDIQDPDHVVLPFPRGGIPTRLENTQTAEPYYRDVM